ncbi:MAG TPA: twin-arginine translocase subunit TatC [Acidimicrobiia bacterium]|nr:twin-arginine translocase subunit TatC [Acidimicrobiia bacterium]
MRADEARPILAHLDELRWRIVKAGAAVLVGAIVAFFFADALRQILEIPFHEADPGAEFQTFTPAEQWGVLMRIAFFGGLILASPVVLYQIWAFINPALTNRERRWAIPIIGLMALLFVGGVVFGYWVLPRGLVFLLEIFPDVRNDLRLSDYYSFTLRFIFAIGVAFLYPVFLFATAAAGLVTSAQLGRWRRWAVLLVVVAAALITPTGDPITLALFSVPLYLMYEATYWVVRLVLRK